MLWTDVNGGNRPKRQQLQPDGEDVGESSASQNKGTESPATEKSVVT